MATATATAEEVERGALGPEKLATLVEAFETCLLYTSPSPRD